MVSQSSIETDCYTHWQADSCTSRFFVGLSCWLYLPVDLSFLLNLENNMVCFRLIGRAGTLPIGIFEAFPCGFGAVLKLKAHICHHGVLHLRNGQGYSPFSVPQVLLQLRCFLYKQSYFRFLFFLSNIFLNWNSCAPALQSTLMALSLLNGLGSFFLG
jgi:hypothetical protein